MPGDSLCELCVFDQDIVGSDDLIGATQIDIENRWLNDKWKVVLVLCCILSAIRNCTVAVHAQEAVRSSSSVLSQQSNSGMCMFKKQFDSFLLICLVFAERLPQTGRLELWVDIFTPSEAKITPLIRYEPVVRHILKSSSFQTNSLQHPAPRS